MLIVSQDKKYVVNTENMISICKENDEEHGFCLTGIFKVPDMYDADYPLGEYSKNEKRNSVIRQILDAYGNDCKVFEMPED